MKSIVAFLALSILQVGPSLPVAALAAPNDFRVVSGTLLYPARLGPDAVVAVLKSDDGAVWHADLRTVSPIPMVERGAAVILVGFEGARPNQVAVQVIYAPEGMPAPVEAPLVRSQRIHGRIESLVGAVVVVRVTEGKGATFLLRGVNANVRGLLQRGDVVTVFGRPAETDFVVTGIIQSQD